MQLSLYNQFYKEFFIESDQIGQQLNEALDILQGSERIFFIGNGGSNAICSHMMEDFFKIGRFPTFAFSDAALITCFANDYGYEHAMKEWLRLHFKPSDLLISISSSGESANILNATELALSLGGKVITLSGFKADNTLSRQGNLNFYLPISNYGIVECFHQVILHALLDQYAANK